MRPTSGLILSRSVNGSSKDLTSSMTCSRRRGSIGWELWEEGTERVEVLFLLKTLSMIFNKWRRVWRKTRDIEMFQIQVKMNSLLIKKMDLVNQTMDLVIQTKNPKSCHRLQLSFIKSHQLGRRLHQDQEPMLMSRPMSNSLKHRDQFRIKNLVFNLKQLSNNQSSESQADQGKTELMLWWQVQRNKFRTSSNN